MKSSNDALIRRHLPCSVELPAGTGKTETIVALVKSVVDEGKQSLVLTHTHAGVDALRRRLKREQVPLAAVNVQTLDSWCFGLIKSFPQLSSIEVDESPDWSKTKDYHFAGAKAVSSPAVQRMLSISYGFVAVDEYQDCQIWQHELVTKIAQCVPTCVLGDRMQGLFYFGNNHPVDWDIDVLPSFPSVEINYKPYRWIDHNEDLGQWLLFARSALQNGKSLDLSCSPVRVIQEHQLIRELRRVPNDGYSVVAISHFEPDAAKLVNRLDGNFTMIEEMEGKFLRAFASSFAHDDAGILAFDTVEFAKNCALGVADVITSRHRENLRSGRRISKRSSVNEYHLACAAVNEILTHPTPTSVRKALGAISGLPDFRLYRREAWQGVLDALRLAESTPDLSVSDAVTKVRDNLRHSGRRPERRIVGRATLVKGLEFDHVYLDVPGRGRAYNAHEIYVSLSRGCRSATIVSDTPLIQPARPTRSTR